MKTAEQLQAEVDVLTKANADFSEAAKAKDAQIATLTTENAGLKKKFGDAETETRKAGFVAFCEKLVGEFRLAPVMKDVTVQQLELAHQASQGAEFAENKTESPLAKIQAALSAAPVVVEFKEFAKRETAGKQGTGTAGEQLDAITVAKTKANKDLSYGAAFAEAQKENIELAQEYAANKQ